MDPPPPPPPHGHQSGQRSSGLPPGNYDIFVIPPDSAGSGFLYLPSLRPNRNSFLAGAACMLVVVMVCQIVLPVLKNWFATVVATGGMGFLVAMAVVGVASWAVGRTQVEGNTAGSGPGTGPGPSHGPTGDAGTAGPPPPHAEPAGGTGVPPGAGVPPQPGANGPPPRPRPTWQRTNAQQGGPGTAQSSWERAREETRKKEEERKAKEKKEEEERKAREERMRAREKEAKERETREKAAKEKETREKDAREREARLRRDKEAAAKSATPAPSSPPKKETPRPDSPRKNHRPPSATTYIEPEEDIYSYRPYDKPKRATKQPSHSSVYSESSYAASQSTARTTPPPSHRGPYSTKDPDKIVIKAVYSFTNAHQKVPTAQLVSGVGSVTDGLILRITTEGLFIDDDVRGVPQREWDVKAWTMKLVEVWCPTFHAAREDTAPSASAFDNTPKRRRASFLAGLSSGKNGRSPKEATGRDADLILMSLLRVCKSSCFDSAPPASASASYSSASASTYSVNTSSDTSRTTKSGDYRGLHVLRASIRDQEGRLYVFILQEEEGWKVAVGLQRLRRGTQVRALGVSGLSVVETRGLLDGLGWL